MPFSSPNYPTPPSVDKKVISINAIDWDISKGMNLLETVQRRQEVNEDVDWFRSYMQSIFKDQQPKYG